MVQVICSKCQQTLHRDSGQNLTLQYIQCICLKCQHNASQLRLTNLKKELDMAKKSNLELQKRYQNYNNEYFQVQWTLQRFSINNNLTLEENVRIMETFINKQLSQQMNKFTQFIDQILDKEDCLENFVTISTTNISTEIQKYASALIEKQTNFLVHILQTQLKNNKALETAMKQYFEKLSESFKTLSIKSNFSEDLIQQNFEMDEQMALIHQNKSKYFSRIEEQKIEKLIQNKILSLQERQVQLGHLIDSGNQISLKYAAKNMIQRTIEEKSSKSNRDESSEPNKEENNSSADSKESANEFSMLNGSESGCNSDTQYENLIEVEKPLEVKYNSKEITYCDQDW